MAEARTQRRPLATVVINNYNYARFLGEAVDSALAQTYTPTEVVVVDDGSTDSSRVVLASYGNRITCILKDNGGQASAFNAGFTASNGEVVIFLDADDVLLPHAVERAVAALAELGVVKAHWPLWEIDASGRRNGRLQPEGVLGDGNLRDKAIADGPLPGIAPPTSGNAWTRVFLTQVFPIPEQEFPINTDGYLVTLAWIYGEVRTLAEPLSLYRVHGGNRFMTMPAHEKRLRHRDFFLRRCRALARHLEAMGVASNINEWKRQKGILDWPIASVAAQEQIARVLPAGSRVVLVDENAFEQNGAVLSSHHTVVPFLGGTRPSDDREAIAEFGAQLQTGADFLVFTWLTAWWLEHYGAFGTLLRDSCVCLHWTDELIIFDVRWLQESAAALHEIAAVVPRDSSVILVDEQAWAEIADLEGVLRKRRPFLEHAGEYAGNPTDDAEAIDALERMRTHSEFIVFPSFTGWWLEHYPGFAAHLRNTARCAVASEHVTVFDLRRDAD